MSKRLSFSTSGLRTQGTSWSREILGGLTTFSAMSYILAVNPSILSTTGMDAGAVFTATALISAIATIAAGLWMNFPLAIAPGMGLNAYFAFTLCAARDVPWQAALTIVFISGLLFLALSLSGIREALVSAFPTSLRAGISAGIGAFILFIGLQNSGIIQADDVTMVHGFNGINSELAVILIAVLLGIFLIHRNIPGNLLIVIFGVAIAGIFIPSGGDGGSVTTIPDKFVSSPQSLEPIFFAFDWGFVLENSDIFFTSVFTFLLVDIFDTTGTLVGIGQRAGVLDENGHWDAGSKAMKIDAASTVAGAALGTSPVTAYIESCAGIESGARTGLASLVTGICFLAALWISPLILALPPQSTAVALIVVGILMLQSLREVNFSQLVDYVPPGICLFLIPMSFSISHGIALGFLSFVALSLLTGRISTIRPMQWGLAVTFLVLLIIN